MDKESKKILNYLKQNKNKINFIGDLDELFNLPILRENIIVKLIKDDLIYHEKSNDRVYIRLKGEEQLDYESCWGWVKRNVTSVVLLVLMIINIVVASLGIYIGFKNI